MQVMRVNLMEAKQSGVFDSRDKPEDVVIDPHRWLLLRPVVPEPAH